MKTLKALSVLAVAGLATIASAQETVTFNNVASQGTRTAGFIDLTHTFTNSFLWGGSVTSSGLITSAGVGSWLTEARIQVLTPLNGSSATPDIQPAAAGTTWSGQASVGPRTQTLTGFTGGPFNPQGQTFTFRFYESFDDGGVNATWDSLAITFNQFVPPPPAATNLSQAQALNLGVVGGEGSFSLDTFGSAYDTELGLFDSLGNLIAENDDTGGLQSQVTQDLLAGTYYAAVGRWDVTYGSGFTVTQVNNGTAPQGESVFSINGVEEARFTAAPGNVLWYSFEVVPAPGTMVLAGMGGLLMVRRRRA